MFELQGKTALVTGGTAGIGLGVVRKFVEEGAHVFVTGRGQGALDAVSAEFGNAVTAIQGDVTSQTNIARIFEAVEARGGLDIVFANAGGGE